MGSATLYQLAQRGVKALGIDLLSPPHSFGSSHGDTRITRQAIGEGEHYTPLSLRSYEIFREMEVKSQTRLLEVTGGLMISS
ncbi:N-methyl-L-tryptophan oxidase, partial [bacterium]|nr:N-methyl-L-tryptophan oxidase [bacterium]MBP9811690.1 N-methyl-L-tryptophan oxidase [bacterium]